MQYTIFKKYFGIEVFGAITFGHFFTILPLDDGAYLSLGHLPKILSKDNLPVKELLRRNVSTNYGKTFWVAPFKRAFTDSILFNLFGFNSPPLAAFLSLC